MSVWGLANSTGSLPEDELNADGRAERDTGLDASRKGHINTTAKRNQGADSPETEPPDESLRAECNQ